MRLSSLPEILSQDLLHALASLNITSDTDLLFLSGTPLDIWRRLPTGLGLSLREFETYVRAVTAKASASGVMGSMLEDEAPAQRRMTVGVPKLDTLLHGLGSQRVVEISGDSGSGKTVRGFT